MILAVPPKRISNVPIQTIGPVSLPVRGSEGGGTAVVGGGIVLVLVDVVLDVLVVDVVVVGGIVVELVVVTGTVVDVVGGIVVVFGIVDVDVV